MKFVDKIKNALFEVEYVVDDKEKGNEDNEKTEETKENKDKPIAKRVILSGHRRDKHKENTENTNENLVVEENQPEGIKEPEVLTEQPKQPDFKVMTDNDFRVDPEPQIQETRQEEVSYERESVVQEEPKVEEIVIYRQEVREKGPYGIDETSKNLVQEYGRAYEKKEERGGFKPSPIISPIYGVLDKNYRKEDVKEKRNVKLTSYSRDSINVDDVRNKAYGKADEAPKKPVREIELMEPEEEKKPVFEEEEDDSNLLVDLSKDNDKPSVKEVTMGDALEYFQDLGLEYNVDYMDASKERAGGRRVKENYEDNSEMFAIQDKKEEEKKVESVPKVEDKPPVITNSNDIDVENDDNLFDLIDSMYDEDK